ncbi:hypothetical protein CDCA_CDCA05G1591 [Cyanidium caldarium]|uniref:Bestrophin homolog n=1 Tax=Cyanidium caldarium TaxID=2771 RepID=A0AAV9ITR6_CYACA|nr:hypothetical protein CDCA_CDCA05G1591 [Cyanidium caldarium]
MTILYVDPIATLGKDYVLPLSWMRLFFYWHGSLLQRLFFEVWLWFGAAAVVIALKLYVAEWPYDLLVPFAAVVNVLNGVLTFMLGFYTSAIYSRWWNARSTFVGDAQGGNYDLALLCTQLLHDDREPELCHRFKQRLLRWCNLAFGLVLKDVVPDRTNFYDSYESMEKIGMMTHEERKRLEGDVDRVQFTLPIMWAGHTLTRLRDQNHRFGVTELVHCWMSQQLAILRTYLGAMYVMKNVPVPLMYRQLVNAAVRIYLAVMVVLAGDLSLLRLAVFTESGANRWLDMLYVVSLFFVYVGWLHVAEELANPYRISPDGHDLDDVLSGQRCDNMAMVDESRLRMPRPDVIHESPLPGDAEWFLPILERDHRYRLVPPQVYEACGCRWCRWRGAGGAAEGEAAAVPSGGGDGALADTIIWGVYGDDVRSRRRTQSHSERANRPTVLDGSDVVDVEGVETVHRTQRAAASARLSAAVGGTPHGLSATLESPFGGTGAHGGSFESGHM